MHSKDIVVRNNIFYNYRIGVGIGDDTVVGPSQRIKIYNNTMINPNPNAGSYNIAAVDNGCFDIEIHNNVLLDVAGTTPLYTGLLDLRNSSTLNGSADYNVLFGPGWDGSSPLFDGLTLSDWQAASGNDLNSYIADPSFINMDINAPDNPNFCSPSESSSALIDQGAFTGAALDYHGNLRDLARDIGAVEYIGDSMDLVSPDAPTGVAATPLSASAIDLSWSAATDNVGVAGYRIYRNEVLVSSTVETTFRDIGCEAATSYEYTIRAYDAAGNTSASSDMVSATTAGQSNDGSADTGTGSGSGGGCFISITGSVLFY